ncbi:MAG: S41 family peptidase [Actinomycetota bacterium]
MDHVEPLLEGDGAVIAVPDVAGADALRRMFEIEHGEMQVELGAPVSVSDRAPSTGASLVLRVDPADPIPRLRRIAPDRVLATGPTLDDCQSALHLIRTMRRTGAEELAWAPTHDPSAAAELLDAELRTTWPSFGRAGIEPPDLRVGGWDLDRAQRSVAGLGDGHTNVHVTTGSAALPYAAAVDHADRLIVHDVAPGTAWWDAGVRPGDEVLDIDVKDVADRAGAPDHLRPWVVGRRALSGHTGVPLTARIRRDGVRDRDVVDTPGDSTWPHPVEWQRLRSETMYLRIRRWAADDASEIDRALAELRSGDRLLVDLRGNAGGSLVAAVDVRRRFLGRATTLGTVRYSVGDGSLSSPFEIVDEPSPRVRWSGRTRFLTDALTYSASEDALLGLSQLPRIDVAGSPSGGGSGRQRVIPLLGDAVLTVSTALTYDHAGRCVEGAGLPIDVPLPDVETPGCPMDEIILAADRDW